MGTSAMETAGAMSSADALAGESDAQAYLARVEAGKGSKATITDKAPCQSPASSPKCIPIKCGKAPFQSPASSPVSRAIPKERTELAIDSIALETRPESQASLKEQLFGKPPEDKAGLLESSS